MENALRLRAVEVAAGNPRLLEWLHGVLQERSLPVSALLDKLEQEEARFREDVLIDELVGTLQRSEKHTLACAALYRLPVALAAIEALTADPQTMQHLQTAAKVGLVEIVPTTDGTRYFVSNLLDSTLADELSEAERQPLAAKASRYLFDATKDGRPEAMTLEIIRLAIDGKEQELAIKLGYTLAYSMNQQSRYREAETLCMQILALGEDFRMLTALSMVEQQLGREQTRQHFERAVEILPDITDQTSEDILWAIASTYLNHASFLQQQGRLDEALNALQNHALPIYGERLNNEREKAVTMGKIAYILQARGQLDEALNKLNETLPVYEKLGDVREKAVTMGKIAYILQARGQLDEALNIRENHELPVYEKLGDVREKTVTMWWIAILLWKKNPEEHRERIRELLCQAKQDFLRMRLPQADSIQKYIESFGLSCDH